MRHRRKVALDPCQTYDVRPGTGARRARSSAFNLTRLSWGRGLGAQNRLVRATSWGKAPSARPGKLMRDAPFTEALEGRGIWVSQAP